MPSVFNISPTQINCKISGNIEELKTLLGNTISQKKLLFKFGDKKKPATKGLLLEYSDSQTADTVYKDNVTRCESGSNPLFIQKLTDVQNNLSLVGEANNLEADGENSDRKIVFVDHRTTEAIKNLFPNAR